MSHVQDRHPSTERLQAFLDGSVSSRERSRVEEHVASCARCAEELATWRVLFEDLDALRTHRPSTDFQLRVMSGFRVPTELPLAARLRAWATRPLRPGHLPADALQDLAEGILVGRGAARARGHLATCAACSTELHRWNTVMARLSDLGRYVPSQGFADRVMAGLAPSPVRAVVRQPAWARALVVARRFLPRTRRAWAALSGAAVTPAVTFGLLLYAVFSHPTLTPQALASFAFWQVTDFLTLAWGAAATGGMALAGSTGLAGLVSAMVDAPLLAAAGGVAYTVAFLVAVRVLYKNLIDSRSIRPRYAAS